MSSSNSRHKEVVETRRIQMMDRSSNLIGNIMIGIINKRRKKCGFQLLV